MLGQVFEAFVQVGSARHLAQGGLGIGLSLVRRLAELHGGSVVAASEGRGRGSTFTLRLPLAGAGQVALPHAQDADARSAPGLRVLVVDDNADAAESLSALLTMLGHHPRAAHDGLQGLEMACEWRPDLVFLDIGLPGMNGHDVARAIRATPGMQQVVLIALTGWGARGDVRLAEDAGFDQHLTKPVSVEALERALGTAAKAPT
jgi:CheY-like chemotaxis protein